MIFQTLKHQSSRFFAALGLSALTVSPVWADDTEIFFANSRAAGALPNVLFILDTSGSMASHDGGSKTRLQRMKDAMHLVIGDLHNVNIGLMRLSTPGGVVRFPSTYIDEVYASNSGEKVGVSRSVSASDFVAGAVAVSGDAVEVIESGETYIDLPQLALGSMVHSAGGIVVTQAYVEDQAHDVREVDGNKNWAVDRCGPIDSNRAASCSLIISESNDFGLTFSSLLVPQGATITDARVNLAYSANEIVGTKNGRHVREPSAGNALTMAVDLTAALAPTPVNFSNSNESLQNALVDAHVNGHVVTPALRMNWRGGNVANGAETTIDDGIIRLLIQNIVNDSRWDGSSDSTTNNIMMVFEYAGGLTDAVRRFQAYDRSLHANLQNSFIPELQVSYTTGGAPEPQPVITGLHFSDVVVPAGARVTRAYIEFGPESDSSGAAQFNISIEDSDNPAPYTGEDHEISNRSSGSSVVWSTPPWQEDTLVRTVDLKSIVQAKVDSAGWCGGNSMAFQVRPAPASGTRVAHSTDRLGGGSPPRLFVEYERDSVIPGSSCIRKTDSSSLAEPVNDAESAASGNSITQGSSIDINGSDFAVLRFPSVDLLPSSEVISASLKLHAAPGGSGAGVDTRLAIRAESTADAESLLDEAISERTFTQSINWDIAGAWAGLREYESPDIGSLIRQIQSNPNWITKNAILLRVDKVSGGNRSITAYEEGRGATLSIVYKDDGSETGVFARDLFLEQVDALPHRGATPVQDTMYEAYQYLTGGDVVWGRYRGAHYPNGTRIFPNDTDLRLGPFVESRLSVAGAIDPSTYSVVRRGACSEDNLFSSDCVASNGPNRPVGEYLSGSPKYVSPIDNACQRNNHIVLLTDGQANWPYSRSLIENIDGIDECDTENANEACVVELVKLMAEGDISPLAEEQKVFTHTVGFNFSSDWLNDIAEAGQGQYVEASSAQELADEINSILAGVNKQNSSFVAPVAAINQFNRLTHLNQIYFAVFRPDEVPFWPGNLKRYELGKVDDRINVILDRDGREAIDPETGFFKAGSRSFWSSDADGPAVDLGGAAENIPGFDDDQRNVYTYLGTDKVLRNDVNQIVNDNTAITAAMLDVASEPERTKQIQWIRGQDLGVTDTQRYSMGDALHSKPIAITYGTQQPADPNAPAPDQNIVVFMGTNAGGLHAINAKTGVEEFVYIPETLLPQQLLLRQNENTQRHLYGVDGSISPWVIDVDNDGIKPGTGDQVYIYFGMRRGGRNYYGMDVTDVNNPKILWRIQGGTGDFAEMGQSWARPIPGRIRLQGDGEEGTDVLYISGGYDPANDGQITRQEDNQGRALYIVNARTGALIWSGGHPDGTFRRTFEDMKYSIPATLTVADANADGFDDLIFVGDTGGQVWRFDIEVNQPVDDLVSGGVIADLGVADGDNTEQRNRRFYHSPDVALVQNEDGDRELAVIIGSGFRASPLSDVTEDRFYMLRQTPVYNAPASYEKVLESDLYDTTDNRIADGVSADGTTLTDEQILAEEVALRASAGWFFGFPRDGEKVLSSPLTVRGSVLFTTYEPNRVAGTCDASPGTSRLYQVLLNNGAPDPDARWNDSDSSLNERNRSEALLTGSIVDEPVIICTGDGCTVFVGTEQPNVNFNNNDRIVRTFWRRDQE